MDLEDVLLTTIFDILSAFGLNVIRIMRGERASYAYDVLREF